MGAEIAVMDRGLRQIASLQELGERPVSRLSPISSANLIDEGR